MATHRDQKLDCDRFGGGACLGIFQRCDVRYSRIGPRLIMPLHGVEKIGIDDGQMLTIVDLALVADLADVERVGQKLIEHA